MNTIQFQERWPELHSDNVRMALRCIPADVAVAMPEEWLTATVRGICVGFDLVADRVRAGDQRSWIQHNAKREEKDG